MASLNYENSINKSAGIASKVDGLTSCLGRIQDLTRTLSGNNERLGALATQIGGTEPPSAGETEAPKPVPDNALFLAKQIENNLEEVIARQRRQMDRIENAIS